MCAVSHGYGGLGRGRGGSGAWYPCWKMAGVGRSLGDVGEIPECEVIHR